MGIYNVLYQQNFAKHLILSLISIKENDIFGFRDVEILEDRILILTYQNQECDCNWDNQHDKMFCNTASITWLSNLPNFSSTVKKGNYILHYFDISTSKKHQLIDILKSFWESILLITVSNLGNLERYSWSVA